MPLADAGFDSTVLNEFRSRLVAGSYAFGTLDWLGMVNIRIQRPSRRSVFTALNDWEPPDTCMTASVRPCVGRTAPISSGSQSIWFLKTPVTAPCISGLHQTWPSDHRARARSSCTLGWSAPVLFAIGRPRGSKMRVSAPNTRSSRSASSTSRREYDRSRRLP